MARPADEPEHYRPRLILLVPWQIISDETGGVEAALSGGDIATVVFIPPADPTRQQTEQLKLQIDIVQSKEVAALVFNDSQLVGRTGADGLVVDGRNDDAEQVRLTCETMRPNKIVGVVAPFSRHGAMVLAECDCDFIMFGRPGSDTQPETHPKILELAPWWAELFQIPVVAHAGSSPEAVTALTTAGVDFIAVQEAVWAMDSAPDQTVKNLNGRIDEAFDQ